MVVVQSAIFNCRSPVERETCYFLVFFFDLDGFLAAFLAFFAMTAFLLFRVEVAPLNYNKSQLVREAATLLLGDLLDERLLFMREDHRGGDCVAFLAGHGLLLVRALDAPPHALQRPREQPVLGFL